MTDERGVTREPLTPDERVWATAMERVDSPDLWVGYSVDWRVKAREAEERCAGR